jgi:hypothetical protein
VALSNRTIAALAQPFEGGGGPSHSAIELIWTSADAADYVGEGNKLERVMGGLRALRDGRRAAAGEPGLDADHEKLGAVASLLATRLVAAGLIAADTVEEALEEQSATTGGPASSGASVANVAPEPAEVVVLFTPDEHVRLRQEMVRRAPNWRLQARPNVLFEAGMAFATHPERTALVVLGDQEIPSDLAGRHYVRLGSVAALRDLAQRLHDAGCPVDLTGNDWLDVSRFPDRSGIPATPT